VELHERSRHLVIGLSLGKGAYKWGGGRFKFSVTQLKSKKEREHIVNTISHYQTSEIAIHCLLLTPPLPADERGKFDCDKSLYVRAPPTGACNLLLFFLSPACARPSPPDPSLAAQVRPGHHPVRAVPARARHG
jgi:hypothetical protein